jgi:hypothetical protein
VGAGRTTASGTRIYVTGGKITAIDLFADQQR